MIKRKAHLFYSQQTLQEHLDKMGDDETLAQYTVYDGMHYIITEKEVIEPRKPYINEQLLERVHEWCTKRNVIYDPRERTCTNVDELLNDFNNWNHSNMSSKTFVPIFEAICASVGNYPEKVTTDIDGTTYLGFKGITVIGKSSTTDN